MHAAVRLSSNPQPPPPTSSNIHGDVGVTNNDVVDPSQSIIDDVSPNSVGPPMLISSVENVSSPPSIGNTTNQPPNLAPLVSALAGILGLPLTSNPTHSECSEIASNPPTFSPDHGHQSMVPAPPLIPIGHQQACSDISSDAGTDQSPNPHCSSSSNVQLPGCFAVSGENEAHQSYYHHNQFLTASGGIESDHQTSSPSTTTSTIGGLPNMLMSFTCNDRKQREFIPDSAKDDKYWERRRKNNEAAKRSREKRRQNDILMEHQIEALTSENTRLRRELAEVKQRSGLLLSGEEEKLLKAPMTPTSVRGGGGGSCSVVSNSTDDNEFESNLLGNGTSAIGFNSPLAPTPSSRGPEDSSILHAVSPSTQSPLSSLPAMNEQTHNGTTVRAPNLNITTTASLASLINTVHGSQLGLMTGRSICNNSNNGTVGNNSVLHPPTAYDKLSSTNLALLCNSQQQPNSNPQPFPGPLLVQQPVTAAPASLPSQINLSTGGFNLGQIRQLIANLLSAGQAAAVGNNGSYTEAPSIKPPLPFQLLPHKTGVDLVNLIVDQTSPVVCLPTSKTSLPVSVVQPSMFGHQPPPQAMSRPNHQLPPGLSQPAITAASINFNNNSTLLDRPLDLSLELQSGGQGLDQTRIAPSQPPPVATRQVDCGRSRSNSKIKHSIDDQKAPPAINRTSLQQASDKRYLDRRRRNNEAVRRCRENKRARLLGRVDAGNKLHSENRVLRSELSGLSAEVKALRQLLSCSSTSTTSSTCSSSDQVKVSPNLLPPPPLLTRVPESTETTVVGTSIDSIQVENKFGTETLKDTPIIDSKTEEFDQSMTRILSVEPSLSGDTYYNDLESTTTANNFTGRKIKRRRTEAVGDRSSPLMSMSMNNTSNPDLANDSLQSIRSLSNCREQALTSIVSKVSP